MIVVVVVLVFVNIGQTLCCGVVAQTLVSDCVAVTGPLVKLKPRRLLVAHQIYQFVYIFRNLNLTCCRCCLCVCVYVFK